MIPAPTHMSPLSLHDALPIFMKFAGFTRTHHRGPARVFDCEEDAMQAIMAAKIVPEDVVVIRYEGPKGGRSEEHTSELQSLTNIVCRLLLEKKKRYIEPSDLL